MNLLFHNNIMHERVEMHANLGTSKFGYLNFLKCVHKHLAKKGRDTQKLHKLVPKCGYKDFYAQPIHNLASVKETFFWYLCHFHTSNDSASQQLLNPNK